MPIRKATDKSEPTSPELYFAKGSSRLTSAQMEPFVLARPPPASWGLDSLGAFKKLKVATQGSIYSAGTRIVPLREAVSDEAASAGLVWHAVAGVVALLLRLPSVSRLRPWAARRTKTSSKLPPLMKKRRPSRRWR